MTGLQPTHKLCSDAKIRRVNPTPEIITTIIIIIVIRIY